MNVLRTTLLAITMLLGTAALGAAEPLVRPSPIASTALQEAQARWYDAQAEEIRSHNAVLAAIPGVAAGLGAWVALMQLLFNYASNTQQQRTALLTEALKRFSDKNPRLRASGAGTLGLAGQTNVAQLDFVVEQLAIGLSLEDDEDVMQAIEYAIRGCLENVSSIEYLAPWRVPVAKAHQRAARQILARARERFFWRWAMPLEDVIRQFGDLGWESLSPYVDGFSIPDDAWAKAGLPDPRTRHSPNRMDPARVTDPDFLRLTSEARRTKQRYDHLTAYMNEADRYVRPDKNTRPAAGDPSGKAIARRKGPA